MTFLTVLFLVSLGMAPAMYGISARNPLVFMWPMLGWLTASPLVAIILSETIQPPGTITALTSYAAWVLPSWVMLAYEIRRETPPNEDTP